MIPISSADQFLTFLDQLKEFTKDYYNLDQDGGYFRFKLYAKFPGQQNSVIDYGRELNEKGSANWYNDHTAVCDFFLPYLEGGLVPYYIKETTAQMVNGSIVMNARTILTYAPVSEVKFYGVEIIGENGDWVPDTSDEKFLTWKEAKKAEQKA
jgi:hypothetical protein